MVRVSVKMVRNLTHIHFNLKSMVLISLDRPSLAKNSNSQDYHPPPEDGRRRPAEMSERTIHYVPIIQNITFTNVEILKILHEFSTVHIFANKLNRKKLRRKGVILLTSGING